MCAIQFYARPRNPPQPAESALAINGIAGIWPYYCDQTLDRSLNLLEKPKDESRPYPSLPVEADTSNTRVRV